jgi:hypothetical protein
MYKYLGADAKAEMEKIGIGDLQTYSNPKLINESASQLASCTRLFEDLCQLATKEFRGLEERLRS